MAADHLRRASTAPLPPPSIPPAPPLPPAKPSTAKSVFARLVTQPFASYGSRSGSTQVSRTEGGRPDPPASKTPETGPQPSRDASHKTGLEISAVDVNGERTHAILAGREILKTIQITGTRCSEETNLRSAIIDYNPRGSTASSTSARNRETLDIHDVKWSTHQFSTTVAAAAASGRIVLYDLNRPGYELARLHEHHRQVHKLAFNPFQGALLLSASQDANVRCWDLRDLRKEVTTISSKFRYSGMSEGIRDIKWSPEDALEFAFGTDNGVIQKWDFKNPKAPKLKLNAHDKTCNSIDWHPDGKHLMSASADKTVKIWDFRSEARRQKPAWVLRTPYPVLNARWRPPCWSADARDRGVWQCTQIATSYDREHSAVHIWDFRRPYLPFRELVRYDTAPTDMLWASQSLLWTVGREGIFAQTDCQFIPKVIDRRNMQAFAVSSLHEITAFVQKRSSSRSSGLEYTSPPIPIDNKEKRISPDKSSFDWSSIDDSVDDRFLSSTSKRHHERTASNRSTRSSGSTPPSSDDIKKPKVRNLEATLIKNKDSYKPDQVAFWGALPGAMDVSHFMYLAHKYKSVLLSPNVTIGSFEEISKTFEQNAEYARRASFYRVAQSFRIAGMLALVSVRRRIEEYKKNRSDLISAQPPATATRPMKEPWKREQAQDQGLQPNMAKRAVYGGNGPQQHGLFESSSNVTTPRARPSGNSSFQSTASSSLPDPDQNDDIALPPAMVEYRNASNTENIGSTTGKVAAASQPGSNETFWSDSADNLETRRAMMSSWQAQPRVPLNLERSVSQGIDIRGRPPIGRHSSDDSFAMFSTSTDSQRGFSLTGSSASTRPQSQRMGHVPEEWEQKSSLYDSSISSGTQSGPALSSRRTEPKAGDIQEPLGTSGSRSSDNKQKGDAEYSTQAIVKRDLEILRRNNQSLRASSSESDPFLSSDGSFASASHSSAMDSTEASGTIIPDQPSEILSSPKFATRGQEPQAATASALAAPHHANNTGSTQEPLSLADFLAMDANTDLEASTPFKLIDMFRSLVDYHTSINFDVQTLAHLLLLLTPLLPPTHPIPPSEASPALSSISDHLTALGLSPAQTRTILSTSLTHLTLVGLNPLQAESILSTYHTQLQSLSLFNAAAHLRRLSYPTYPAVYEQALKDTQVALLCTQCHNPINNSRDKMRCESCHGRQAECPVCWCKTSPYDGPWKRKKTKLKSAGSKGGKAPYESDNGNAEADPTTVPAAASSGPPLPSHAATVPPQTGPPAHPILHFWCPTCGHGGHFACLSAWFADILASEGACPTPGCLCDCVPGPRRSERIRALEARVAEREAGKVRGDEWRVGESRAVGRVRGALGGREEGKGRRVRVVEPGVGGGRG